MKGVLIRLMVVAAVVLTLIVTTQWLSAVAQSATAAAEDAQPRGWPMYRGNPARTGAMPGPGFDGPPAILWQFAAGASVFFPPAIADGVIYLPTDSGVFYALDTASGAVHWQGEGDFAMPSAQDGVLYAVSISGDLVARDLATEQEFWHVTPGSRYWTPLIADGAVYYGGEDNLLVARDSRTGEERWVSAQTSGASRSAALADGIVVVGSDDGNVYGLDQATGETTWQFTLVNQDATIQTPAIANGAAYVGTFGGEQNAFVALDLQTGAERWRLEGTDGEGFHAAGVAEGVVYVPSDGGSLRALDAANGEVRWTFTSDAPIDSAPAIVDGVVYVGSSEGGNGIVLALDAATGDEHWRLPLEGQTDFGPALVDGQLFLGTQTGNFYAVGAASDVPAGTPPVVITPDGAVQATPEADEQAADVPARFVWSVGAAPPAAFSLAPQLSVAPNGDLWVLDGERMGFQIFAPDGTLRERWGSAGDGEGQFDFRRDPDWTAGDVAFTADGGFYVADYANSRIQQFDAQRQFVRSWGSFGTEDGQFSAPVGVYVGPDGDVYVIDEMREDVQKFTVDGQFLLKFGGHGSEPGKFNFAGWGDIDPDGNFWIVDWGNNRLQQFAPDGVLLQVVGEAGSGNGQFDQPQAMAIDDAGRMYVTDSANARVQVFDRTGQFLYAFDGSGIGGEHFAWIVGIAVDNSGGLYVLQFDHPREQPSIIQKFQLT